VNQTIGILGIGNTLLQDEGFGPHIIEQIETRFQVPETVKLLDGGTAGILLGPFIESVNTLYIVDTVKLNAPSGSIQCFSEKEISTKDIQTRMSPHQVGILETLELCRLRGKAPDKVEMLTVVPETLNTGIGLSGQVAPAVEKMISLIMKRLANHGIIPEKLTTVS